MPICYLKSFRIKAAAWLLFLLLVPAAVQSAGLERAQSLPDAVTDDPQRRPILDRPGGPQVLGVFVIQEDEHSLRLGLKLEFLDGYDVLVEALDAEGMPLSAVPAGVVAVDQPLDRAFVELAVPPGPEMEASSSYLRIVARRQERREDFLRLYYAYERMWEAPPPVVRPEPIGEAVELLRRLRARGEELSEEVAEQAEATAEDVTAEQAEAQQVPAEEAEEQLPSIGVVEEALPPDLAEEAQLPHEILRPQVEAVIEPPGEEPPEIALEEGLRELRPGIAVREAMSGQLLETAEPQDQLRSGDTSARPQAAILPLTATMEIDTSDLKISSGAGAGARGSGCP